MTTAEVEATLLCRSTRVGEINTWARLAAAG